MKKVSAVTIGIILVLVALSTAYADYTYTPLPDYPGASSTYAYGINNSDTIVGGAIYAGGWQGFSLTGTTYTPIDYPGAPQTIAEGINNSGTIVGAYFDASGLVHGFSLTGTTYTPIDYPGVPQTQAVGINDSGTIVGAYVDASGLVHGFSLTGTTYTPIDYPGVPQTEAYGINNGGTTIVGLYIDASGHRHGYSLTGTTYTPIDHPGASQTGLEKINDAGTIVGWYYYPEVGFTLAGGTYTPVIYPGAACSTYGINDAGVIVGRYTNSTGTHAFIATPVPSQDKTPPTITMASVDPSVLWPPNHKMVDVTVNYTATDDSGQPACKISGVTSNESISSSDYSIVDAHHVKLSADRSGRGNGRMYTIAITCTDASGNASTQTMAVSVPHDQGKN